MRIAAIGDAHLGRSYYPYVDPETRVNQREHDFECSFESAVEAALAANVELVVWLGDIFDHPRPSYRSYRIAQRAMRRIRDHGVMAVAISGNHDTPRLPGQGSPYSAMADAFPEMFWAHRLSYERFELPGLVIHAVPQMMKTEQAIEALAEVDRQRSTDKTNLLITHPRLLQVPPKYADINEIEIDQGALKADLVLLGHYHTYQQVIAGMWYAGAPDTFTFGDEPDIAKGIVVLDTDTGECVHVPIEAPRRLVTLETISAAGLGPAELQARVLERVAKAPEGSVARLYIDLVEPEAYRLLDMAAVRDAGAHALHLKLEPSMAATASRVELPQLDAMPAQWTRYMQGQHLEEGFDRERLQRLGEEYLARALEEAGPS